ncbi:hypothetical protein O3M35_005841 [Rhynocoris fuscipes]|uniref:Uncharacterized protein n=1 Tax=Rhynocoris fuscipes TaxID=488301 RepID=A0AAW1DLR4_9HEMI
MRDSETMCSIPAQLEDACVQCDSESSQHQNNDNIDFMKELEERDNELELVLCENTRLREVVKELQDEIERQNESLPAIPENSEEVEALELRVSVLENETSILREVRSNLETEVASSRAIIEDLSRRLQISDAMIRNQDTNAQCSDEEKIASSVREQCEQELNALREHCEKVESSLRSLELQSGDALAKLRREVEEKDRRREELERELERLQNEMAEERRQYSMNLEVENASYKRKISQLQGELQKMDEQLDKLQKEQEIKDKKMCALVFETNSIKEEFDFYKNEMDSNYSSLKEEYDAFRESSNTSESAAKQVLHVETQVTDDINSRGKLERTIVNLENELKHQQDMHSEIETELKLQIKEQELMIQSLKESELNIKHEFMNKKSECESLQLRIEDLQRELEQSDVTMKEQKAEYDSQRDALVKQLDSLKQISNEFDLSKDIFKQKEIEFKNQLELKDDEIVSLKNRLKSLNERFNELNCKLTENIDYKEISAELQEKYNTLLEASNKSAEEAQQKICSMMEELKELKTIIDASEQRLKQSEENSNHNLQMCESIKLEFLKKIENERLEYEERIEKINLEKRLLEGKLAELTKENDEKFTAINTENQQLKQKLEMENVKCLNYQNEIERLNSVLMTEKTKFEKCLHEKQQEIAAEKIIAANFMAKQNEMEDVLKNKNKEISILSQEVGSLKNQLEYASQLLSVVPRQEAEGQQVADANISGSQNQSCPNGCKETQDELNRIREALMKEQTENKLLKNQVNDLNEKVGKSTSQLSRLQAHLLSVEENYTSELQNAQLKITDLQGKLVEADDRARNSSTAYTSANIRANQQVESLNQQLRLLTEHKEKLEAELSKAEDNIQRQNAAVTNLQAVLDHFQRDKKKDIDFETERLRQSLNAQCKKNEDLLNEIKLLQDQLNETKKGLAAANRLSEQLDQKSEIISNLKTQGT